jgi:predicted ABC-type ATPase
VERVKVRVADGGHDVPKRKIRERREKSLGQLPWFLAQADGAWIFDNSERKPRRIVTKLKGVIETDPSAMPEIIRAVQLARAMPIEG